MKPWADIEITELSGVDTQDYPDFVDVFAVDAFWPDSTPLTDDELDILNSEHGDLVHQAVYDHLF